MHSRRRYRILFTNRFHVFGCQHSNIPSYEKHVSIQSIIGGKKHSVKVSKPKIRQSTKESFLFKLNESYMKCLNWPDQLLRSQQKWTSQLIAEKNSGWNVHISTMRTFVFTAVYWQAMKYHLQWTFRRKMCRKYMMIVCKYCETS